MHFHPLELLPHFLLALPHLIHLLLLPLLFHLHFHYHHRHYHYRHRHHHLLQLTFVAAAGMNPAVMILFFSMKAYFTAYLFVMNTALIIAWKTKPTHSSDVSNAFFSSLCQRNLILSIDSYHLLDIPL